MVAYRLILGTTMNNYQESLATLFTMQPSNIEAFVDQALLNAEAALSAVEAAPASTENTLVDLEKATKDIQVVLSGLNHRNGVLSEPQYREIYNRVQPRISSFLSNISRREKLWERIAAVDDAKNPLEERLLELTKKAFIRSGAALPAKDKERISEIHRLLTIKGTEYSQKILDATNASTFHVQTKPEGVPETACSMAKQAAQDKKLDGYLFTLQQPSYLAVVTHAKDRELREKVWRAYAARGASGTSDTRKLICEMIELRHEFANLLGYRTFVDFVLADRMANSAERLKEFQLELDQATQSPAHKEHLALVEFTKHFDPDAPLNLKPWDIAYYTERMYEKQFAISDEQIRAYFPMPKVIEGIFAITEKLFGVTILSDPAVISWHETTTGYSVSEGKKLLGTITSDYIPRASKRGGAWMDQLIPSGWGAPTVNIMCGNFMPPTNGKPALLSHDEVCTLLHEFGHILHGVLCKAPYQTLSMEGVPWDFIEVPSQLMENWAWTEEGIALLSSHVDTGATLPKKDLDTLISSQTFRKGTSMRRQLGQAILDRMLHDRTLAMTNPEKVIPVAQELLQNYAAVELPVDLSMVTSFTHVFSSPIGYACGYYSYAWSEMVEAAIFEQFKKQGVLNETLGRKYKQSILDQGAINDANVMVEQFLGSKVATGAMLRRAGLQ